MAGQVQKAKRVAIIALIISLILGLIFSVPIAVFDKQFTRFFITDNHSSKELQTLFNRYLLILPCQLFLGVVYSINRALGKQEVYIFAQLICEYVFHFGSMYFLLTYTKLGSMGFLVNLGLTYIVMIACTSMIVFGANWKKESVKIRRSMIFEKEKVPGNSAEVAVGNGDEEENGQRD